MSDAIKRLVGISADYAIKTFDKSCKILSTLGVINSNLELVNTNLEAVNSNLGSIENDLESIDAKIELLGTDLGLVKDKLLEPTITISYIDVAGRGLVMIKTTDTEGVITRDFTDITIP